MGELSVDPDGLDALASRHLDWTEGIEELSPAAVTGLPYQPTTAAIAELHDVTTVASQTMTTRLRSTAEKLTTAARHYRDTDDVEAAAVKSAGDTMDA